MHRGVFIGIDEAGRGPLAGPVAVGAVAARVRAPEILSGIKDSKTLSAAKREEWYRVIAAAPELAWAVAMIGPGAIDRQGISRAVSSGIARVLAKLAASPRRAYVLLDGGIAAPAAFHAQETIVRGDATEPLIAAGAIIAKVTRDRYMVRLAKRYPQYGFAIHKGYGTKAHREMIVRHGACAAHRRTYLTNILACGIVESEPDPSAIQKYLQEAV